jgi:hypothetical protein
MYAPTNRLDARSLAFAEIYNSNPWPEDLSGYYLTVPTGNTLFRFPSNAVLGAHGFVAVAADPGLIAAIYGVTNVLGPFLNELSLFSGVTLRSPSGATLVEMTFQPSLPWPVAASGPGHSLVVAAPSYGTSARAFSYSAAIGGSPGRAEPAFSDALADVVINEVLPWSTNGAALMVELYNHRATPADLSGCVLADSQGSNFVITPGTILDPGTYAEFLVPANGRMRALGGELFLYNAARTRVVDAISFASQPPGRSCGRTPDGSSRWKPLEWPTPGARNSRGRVSEVVISELNFGAQGLIGEFVELYNRGTNDVTIEGWVLDTGKTFVLPPHTKVPANRTLVLGYDASVPVPPGTALLPNYNIGLDNSGEQIRLLQPQMFSETNATTGGVTNYKVLVEADVVEYGAGHRLGSGRDYLTASLERQDYFADPEAHGTWIERLPEEAWDVVNETGVLELGVGVCDALQVMLLGAGEALVDDVEVIGNSGANLLANGTFENGLGDALARGNHEHSFVESGAGFNGSAGLHLRASGRGETGPNNVRFPLAAPLAPGTAVTIRAKVRWLKGHPEILFRLKGNYFEGFHRISKQFGGSLGKPNVALNLGPEIHESRHEPVLPAPNHPVIVTALVSDGNGVGTVTLYYRLDPSPAYAPVPMRDDGQAPDTVAGDGTFAGQIPGQSANTLVAFYMEATDSAVPPASRVYPLDAPARECLVRFGETSYANAFPSYRVWMTQAARARWAAREKLSNQPVPVTFVYGTNRVIYHAGARYSGSAEKSQFYDAPDGTLCGYDILLPENEQVLGADQLILDPPPPGSYAPAAAAYALVFPKTGAAFHPAELRQCVRQWRWTEGALRIRRGWNSLRGHAAAELGSGEAMV